MHTVLVTWTLSRSIAFATRCFTRQFTKHVLAHHQNDIKMFFYLRRLCKLRCILDIGVRKRLVCAVILTRVDYCNSVLANLSDCALTPLQRVFHAAMQFVFDLWPWDHITVALQTLHWLPMCQHITDTLCTLMHAVAFGCAPSYVLPAAVPLSTLPGRAHLRSADNGQYDVPRVSSSVGSRAFFIAGLRAWNQLPISLRQIGLC